MLASVVSNAPAPTLPERKVLKLAAGESVQYPVAVPHDDSVVAWYLQGAGDSWQDKAATALTAQIMSSGFFQELRTEQQLGYVVGAVEFPQGGSARPGDAGAVAGGGRQCRRRRRCRTSCSA